MIRSLVISLGKKYLVSALNDLLEKYRDNVSYIVEIISLWIKRLQVIIEELKKILSRISDGKIEDEEIKESIKEIEQIIKEW